MTFNYGDTLAVIKLAKKVLHKNEYPCSEGDAWLAEDEAAWHGYCTQKKGVYTPFPEIGTQPDEIQKEFADNEDGIDFVPQHNPENSLHRDMVVDPYQKDRATGALKLTVAQMDQPEPKRSKPGSVNFGIMQGSMSRFDNNETKSNKLALSAPNKPIEADAPASVKQPAQVHARNADGKSVTPGKDILEKTSDPEFDSSHPTPNAQTKQLIDAAPDHTDTKSKEGTDEEKNAKDAKLEKRDANLSVSTR